MTCQQITKEGWILPDQKDVTGCDAASRPTERQACNMGECSAEYHWRPDVWSEVHCCIVLSCIIGVCTDTYVISQSVLEKKYLCIAN